MNLEPQDAMFDDVRKSQALEAAARVAAGLYANSDRPPFYIHDVIAMAREFERYLKEEAVPPPTDPAGE